MLFGHPTGLFTLFFAEMWERFSYYGMRSILVFYMMKGFLGYGDSRAYEVYGAYTALVYATPFIGGMLADRLLGSRRAVILGGILMAAGHLLMTIQTNAFFFTALAMLIVGNGFFKPNISTIVGTLYPKGSKTKDAGFTIFYMGINLGAGLAPLVCGYVGETYGWHNGFGLATLGMLIGLAVFVAPTRVTQALILLGAFGVAGGMIYAQRNDALMLLVYAPVGLALLAAAFVSATAVGRGGIPDHLGRAPAGASRRNTLLVYAGSFVMVPALAYMVYNSGIAKGVLSAFGAIALFVIVVEAFRGTKVERERLFVVIVMFFFSMLFWAFFEQAGSSVNNFTDRNIARVNMVAQSKVIAQSDVGKDVTFEPNQAQVGYQWPVKEHVIHTNSKATIVEFKVPSGQTAKADTDVIVLQPVAESRTESSKPVTLKLKDLHPSLIEGAITWNRAVGQTADDPESKTDSLCTFNGKRAFTLDQLDELREAQKKAVELQEQRRADAAKAKQPVAEPAASSTPQLTWRIDPSHVGMLIDGKEIPASVFQAVNPVCIMFFGLLFTAMWGFLGRRNAEPNTSVKFSLGLLQLALGFFAFWWGAKNHDSRGMASMSFLILGYTLHTTGELCLSPVGLSMVTRLSPVRIVAMVMGSWFLATAFSNLLAGELASLTGVSESAEGGSGMPVPLETVNVYGDVFFKIGVAGAISAVVLFILSPLLTKWEHRELDGVDSEGSSSGGH
jgi:POT family proton-dependent oligopeptide transporter